MNLTRGQIFSIIIVILSVTMASTSQLTDLFGVYVTKYIVSASSLLTAILGGINAVLGGQSGQVAAVTAMLGVEKIVVNEDATPTLATLAVSSDNNKVETKPGAEQAVQATATAAAS